MSSWASEAFGEIINHGHFSITEPGPLHAPIRSFSVRRDEKLHLILETHCDTDATSTAIERPAGTVRISTDTTVLTNIGGIVARAVGVEALNVSTSFNHQTGERGLREYARVLQHIEAIIRDDLEPRYTIDWLENFEARSFVWPELVRRKKDTTETLIVGDDGITLTSDDEDHSFSRNCVGFSVSGVKLYACASWQGSSGRGIKPGCIIYVGAPDDDTRRKIRTALSFSLGIYLVYLGHTVFSDDWHTIYFKSVNGYSAGQRVFDLHVLPPAPLGPQYQHEITIQAISRMVNAIYSQYNELKFDTLSWIYWHALCATMQTAPADFGAAIEALQRNYVKLHSTKLQNEVGPRFNEVESFIERDSAGNIPIRNT